MDVVVCPHCHSHRIVTTKIPRDVVAVMPCPSCHELAVLFRDKVIALNRRILESGTFEERKEHLAHVIAEFLEAGMLPAEGFTMAHGQNREFDDEDVEFGDADEDQPDFGEITDREMEQFVKIDLKCIDDPSYFRKHFG